MVLPSVGGRGMRLAVTIAIGAGKSGHARNDDCVLG
jgi:hypothetical protein